MVSGGSRGPQIGINVIAWLALPPGLGILLVAGQHAAVLR
jgi:hypothetical protein